MSEGVPSGEKVLTLSRFRLSTELTDEKNPREGCDRPRNAGDDRG
ncbi:MAG: hypothetical protein ACI4OZ_09675 [Akkermansia sp.]